MNVRSAVMLGIEFDLSDRLSLRNIDCMVLKLSWFFVQFSTHHSTDKRGDLMDDIIGVLNTHDEEDAAYLQVLL